MISHIHCTVKNTLFKSGQANRNKVSAIRTILPCNRYAYSIYIKIYSLKDYAILTDTKDVTQWNWLLKMYGYLHIGESGC